MSKTMAEVLGIHPEPDLDNGYWYCTCGHDYGVNFTTDSIATHQQDMLEAAGFGLVADAKAEALREAAEHFKQRSDTLHNTMLEMTGLPDFTAEDITRYGAYSAEANGTATWLRTKAAVIRNQS